MNKDKIRILIKNFIRDWLLPPKIKEVLRYFKGKPKNVFLKDWKDEPINTGLHSLENFKNCDADKYWLALNREVRAGIIVHNEVKFGISGKDKSCEYLQIGFGSRKTKDTNSVKIFINDVLSGCFEDSLDNIWHDIRLELNSEVTDFNLRIEQAGHKQLYVSHPILIKKAESVNKAKLNKPKNIICLIIDGVNFSYLKQFNKKIAPRLFEFFEDGIFCNQAFAQADWTLPAFSSILTGLYVSRHGICHPGPNEFYLDKELLTLPQLMLKEGYRTYAHSGHLRFNPAYGHAKGFERFIFRPFSNEFSYVAIQDVIFQLEAHKNEFNFIMMHVFDTHPPYRPSSYLKENLMRPSRDDKLCEKAADGINYDSHQDNMRDEFVAKFKEFDISLDNLFTYLKKNNMVDDTLVIFTADHGISYAERGKPRLFDERIHVPLLVKGPNINKGEEDSLIESSIDLMPSILHCAGVDIPDYIDGRVWPFLGGIPKEKALSESLYEDEYSVVIKDDKSCYHLSYPLNIDERKVDFKQRNPIVFYNREKPFDVEEEARIEEKDKLRIYDEVENFYLTSKKYYE